LLGYLSDIWHREKAEPLPIRGERGQL